jgi:LytS/YehU family sensor histidine kinase
LAASIAISLVLLALFALVFFITSGKPLLSHYRELLISSVHSQVLTYGIVVGVIEGIDYYRKYREREVRAFQLQTRLAEAELEALKMQLHPHFLFNTLNSISVLMSEDVITARRMLTRLSELLRISLDSSGRHEVALKAELEFLSNYLEIERTRFQDRLTVRMEIEPEVLEAQVPNLILQPLVENAIRHGISPRAQPGVIEIFARRENQSVQIQIRDNGAGLGTASLGDVPKGIGIANTEARLNQLYGSAHRFDLKSGPEGGVLVTIEIPFCPNSAQNHAGDNSWK